MGDELSFLPTRTRKVWTLSMALGFSLPYDNLVKNQCDQLHSRFEDYASEAKQQNFLGTLDDFLGSRGHQRQNIESFVKF